tara:strand:+ start:18078 stop:20525 length:2448 start_codon:yes stop_codon:yes gene_type:complete
MNQNSDKEKIEKLNRLYKILKQESLNEYNNKTVIGGLDKLLDLLSTDLEFLNKSTTNYEILSQYDRAEWVEKILKKIILINPKIQSYKSTDNFKKPHISKPKSHKVYTNININSNIQEIPNLTKNTQSKLNKLGINKIIDMIYFFPRRHYDFTDTRKISSLQFGVEQTIIGTVTKVGLQNIWPKKKSTEIIISDQTGNVRAIWFNQPWLSKTIKPNSQIIISGKVNVFRRRLVFESPEYEIIDGQADFIHTGRLVPIYPSTSGLAQRTIRKIIKQSIDIGINQLTEHIPTKILYEVNLTSLKDAILQIHYPKSKQDWSIARKRLAFDELFLIQLLVVQQKEIWSKAGSGTPLDSNNIPLNQFLNSLPFELTKAQQSALNEILKDISRDRPMRRLLQGDVGSGKTVIALASLLVAVFKGYCGAMMVPTEVLAEQHFTTISSMTDSISVTSNQKNIKTLELPYINKIIHIGLLIGSLTKKEKEELNLKLQKNEIDILIGTHALIQDSVKIPRLALVVIDEQHRFGVNQRSLLSNKGNKPHLLAMSATPIPRSLALTIFGDLDISVINEIPPGRQPIRTRFLEPNERLSAYNFIAKQINQGRQAFIICPLIEESETIQSKAAIKEFEKLSHQVFPNLKLGLLHGRMSAKEKNNTMLDFKNKKTNILVSTAVIEVGIDIPNASTILIDGAERFGLSQLHQFRGRVGRGEHESYCILLSESKNLEAKERLKILERITDGFELAEEDLKIRGPGDHVGTKQSGLPNLKIANIHDYDILSIARNEAIKIIQKDPELQDLELNMIKNKISEYKQNILIENNYS